MNNINISVFLAKNFENTMLIFHHKLYNNLKILKIHNNMHSLILPSI